MKTYETIKIAIAEDHKLFREGFKQAIVGQSSLEFTGEAENGKELLDLISSRQPDIAIVDIKMPVMDGIMVCKAIKKKFSPVQVIALSMFSEDQYIIDMIEAGARGYLLKNTGADEIMQAARTVYTGNTYYSSPISDKLNRMVAERKFNPHKGHPGLQFTDREIEILKLMAEQYSNKEIATKLGLSKRTVESHRERLQEKTNSRNSIGIITYALKNDLIRL